MMLGTLSYTNSKDTLAMASSYGFTPIALVESVEDLEIPFRNNIQLASVLLPSYDAISAALDNDIMTFNGLYQAQLCGRECDEFISLIMYALFKGKNILLYIAKDEMELPYPFTLFNYIESFFGYKVGVEFNRETAMYNQAYDAVLINKFYVYDFIGVEEFVALYPPGVELDPMTVNKLAFDVCPPVEQNPVSLAKYFSDMINAAHGIYRSIYIKK